MRRQPTSTAMAPPVTLKDDTDSYPSVDRTWIRLHDLFPSEHSKERGKDLHKHSKEEANWYTQVAEEVSFNLKEAMKMLQEQESSQNFGQNQEAKRKVSVKKAMSRLGRALRQLALLDDHMEELKVRMHNLQENLEVSQGAHMEVLQRMDAVASEMQGALRRLREEEDVKDAMVSDLEAAKMAADMAKRSAMDTMKQVRVKETEREKLLMEIACLKSDNEKLQTQLERAKKERRHKHVATEKAADSNNTTLSAQVERYKEVVARVTADNMVFLMKLRHSEAALQTAKERQQQLEKEIEINRGRWLEEASAEIEDAVRGTLTKAEACETELERLQREEGKAASEWQLKLQSANERLAHVTATRDWLEETLVQTRDRIKVLEEEKLVLQEKLDAEVRQRHHAEGDTRALVSTLRETTEQVNAVKAQHAGALQEVEAKKKDLQTKEQEVEQLLAALENASLQLETQQNVNASIMRKKEEIEWQCMEAEAERNKLRSQLSGYEYRREPQDTGSS